MKNLMSSSSVQTRRIFLLARAARRKKFCSFDRKTDLTKGVHTTGICAENFEDFEFPAGTLGKAIGNVALYSPQNEKLSAKRKKDEFHGWKMGLLYKRIFCRIVWENGVEQSRYVSAGSRD